MPAHNSPSKIFSLFKEKISPLLLKENSLNLNTEFNSLCRQNRFEEAVPVLFYKSNLLEIELNELDKFGWGAIHYSCLHNNINFLNVLLYNEADVNLKGKNGLQPLMITVTK